MTNSYLFQCSLIIYVGLHKFCYEYIQLLVTDDPHQEEKCKSHGAMWDDSAASHCCLHVTRVTGHISYVSRWRLFRHSEHQTVSRKEGWELKAGRRRNNAGGECEKGSLRCKVPFDSKFEFGRGSRMQMMCLSSRHLLCPPDSRWHTPRRQRENIRTLLLRLCRCCSCRIEMQKGRNGGQFGAKVAHSSLWPTNLMNSEIRT